MKITDQIIRLDCTRGASAYAIMHQIHGEVTLIDTGYAGKGRAILAELQSHGVAPDQIRRILLTHSDMDHIGNVAYIQARTNCDVYISAADRPYALREKKPGGIKNIISALPRQPLSAEQLLLLPAGSIAGIEIIDTAGHTRGHVCFRYENILFAGDLITENKGRILETPAFFTWNRDLSIRSCLNLNLTGIAWICPAHGEPLPAQPAWATFIRTLAGSSL